ncbi:hypothetical protein Efla_002493 [Eimeria flavescens]
MPRHRQRVLSVAAAAATAAAALSVLLLPAADGFAVEPAPAFLVASTIQSGRPRWRPPLRAPLPATTVAAAPVGALQASALAAAAAPERAAAVAAEEEEEAGGGGDSVTKKELIERVAVELSLPRSQVEKTVNLFNAFVQQDLVAGKRVYISRLGTFSLRRRGSRSARNPKTGEALEAPAATFPSFSFSRSIKEAVRNTIPLSEAAEGSPAEQQPPQQRQQQHPNKKDSKLFGWLP